MQMEKSFWTMRRFAQKLSSRTRFASRSWTTVEHCGATTDVCRSMPVFFIPGPLIGWWKTGYIYSMNTVYIAGMYISTDDTKVFYECQSNEIKGDTSG